MVQPAVFVQTATLVIESELVDSGIVKRQGARMVAPTCEGCGVRPASDGVLCRKCAQAEKQAGRDGVLGLDYD